MLVKVEISLLTHVKIEENTVIAAVQKRLPLRNALLSNKVIKNGLV